MDRNIQQLQLQVNIDGNKVGMDMRLINQIIEIM